MQSQLRLPVLLLWIGLTIVVMGSWGLQTPAAWAQSPGEDEPLTVSATIVPPQGNVPGHVVIVMKIERPWHTYSITQPKGGPFTTQIKVNSAKGVKVGAFRAATKPEVHFDDDFKMNVEVHHEQAVWAAPLELTEGVWEDAELSGLVQAQACQPAACLPPQQFRFTAKAAAAK